MYISPRSRCTSFVSNSNFQPAKSNESSSSNSVSTNSDIEKQTGSSANRKPRRTSSHIPPNKSNLETSKNLRLSLSSGNIRDNVNPETDDVISREPEQEPVLMSPRQKGMSKLQNFSFDANSLSIESVDRVSFTFDVSKFFAFGSPIGLVIAFRRLRGDNRCCKWTYLVYDNNDYNNKLYMFFKYLEILLQIFSTKLFSSLIYWLQIDYHEKWNGSYLMY